MKNTQMAPGSLHGLHLVVTDIEAARAQLVERGGKIAEITTFGPELFAVFGLPPTVPG